MMAKQAHKDLLRPKYALRLVVGRNILMMRETEDIPCEIVETRDDACKIRIFGTAEMPGGHVAHSGDEFWVPRRAVVKEE